MSKSECSSQASAMGRLPRQRCCAFKDRHVMWGQRSPVNRCPPQPPIRLADLSTLSFHSVYFISNGNTCREAWSPQVPPGLDFTKLKRRENPKWRSPGPGAPLSHFV